MEKIKNKITELVFILDRSGSMGGLECDTIDGFNFLIEKQRKQDSECYVSTVLFDNESEVIHDRVKLSEIKPMKEKEYYVRGCTALIDAIGGAIHHIGNIHKYARPEDVPEHTMFVITTAPELETELMGVIDDVAALTLDFEKLDYISSAGLRVLLSAQKKMNTKGEMKLTHVNDTIMEIFEVTGFSDILTIE
mgnify:CR=1 FL=1